MIGKTNKGADIQSSTQNKKFVDIFNIDEDSDESTPLPKNAKVSKNIGRDTQVSSGPYNFGYNTQAYPWQIFESRKHHLNKPQEMISNEKSEQINQEDNKINELKKFKELIKVEKIKVKICHACKRKFANSTHLSKHEKFSELHKKNIRKK